VSATDASRHRLFCEAESGSIRRPVPTPTLQGRGGTPRALARRRSPTGDAEAMIATA
jgi:hypothetical protein